MKIFYHQKYETPDKLDEDYYIPTLREDIVKTRLALEIAYAGFDNAVDMDMIDSYIYEINALLKRYRHLSRLAEQESENIGQGLYTDSPIRTLVGHVLS